MINIVTYTFERPVIYVALGGYCWLDLIVFGQQSFWATGIGLCSFVDFLASLQADI